MGNNDEIVKKLNRAITKTNNKFNEKINKLNREIVRLEKFILQQEDCINTMHNDCSIKDRSILEQGRIIYNLQQKIKIYEKFSVENIVEKIKNNLKK